MSCECPIDYYSRPFDFKLSDNAHNALFENRDPQHFTVRVEDTDYDFVLQSNIDFSINYKITMNRNGHTATKSLETISLDDISETYDFERDGFDINEATRSNISDLEKCDILRRLFLGKSIMIDYHNFSFIHHAANSIGIPELQEISDLTNKSYTKKSNQFIFYYKKNVFYIKRSCKSFFFHFWTSIFSFFAFFGLFGRVLQSFWDLSGPTMVVCLFLNILILFITMALKTLKDYLACFFLVIIPFLLYSLYFPNIICISIIEAIERNLFFKRTFFYRHQRLFQMFMKVVFNYEKFPEYFNFGKLHNFIHGILFLVFFCGFLANLMNNRAPKFLNVWLIIFVFYIPLIRYFALYIFYLIHSIVSLFDKPRRRFLEIGDFDDPFLCSFYLNERSWIDFFKASKKSKLSHHGRLLVRMIFSKTSYSILATIAVIIYMCCAKTKMSAGQVCITIFIGIFIIFVLSTRISFPFFWIYRIRGHRLTEGMIEEMRENIPFIAQKRLQRFKTLNDAIKDQRNPRESEYLKTENDFDKSATIKGKDDTTTNSNSNISLDEFSQERNLNIDQDIKDLVYRQEALKWHYEATTWSKKYNYLRWSSIILICLTFVFIVVLVPMAGATAVKTSNEEDNSNTFEPTRKNSIIYNMYEKYLNDRVNSPLSYNYKNGDDDFSSSAESDNETDSFNESFRYPLSPICFLKPKGITMFEVVALTMLSDPRPEGEQTEEYYWIIDEFLSQRGKIGKDIIFVDTPFIHDKSFQSSMTLTRFRNSPKLSVFAIRGTSNDQDIIADAEIWFASVVINVMISVMPFVSIYSDKTVELIGVVTNLPRYAFKQFSLVEEYKNKFINYIYEYVYGNGVPNTEINLTSFSNPENENFFNNLKKFSSSSSPWLFEGIEKRTKKQIQKSFKKSIDKPLDIHLEPDEDVMIIGHSLGGGLAKIISLVTGIQAVALSGPGVRYIGHFYRNSSVKNVRETIIDIIPGQDLIARVDASLGSQIHIPCRRGLSCHNSKRNICQMSVMCNTFEKHADFCNSFFDKDQIDEMFKIGQIVRLE